MARSNQYSRSYRDENYRDRGLKEQSSRSNRNRERHLIRDFEGRNYDDLQDQWEDLEEMERMDS